MKIFEKDHKVNFVDENNVMLGYDSEQQCCEHASWYIADSIKNEAPERRADNSLDHIEGNPDLTEWVFDPSFFQMPKCEDPEDGVMAVFRLIHKNGPEKERFLHLFNAHNGYYSHGFELCVDGKMWYDGNL